MGKSGEWTKRPRQILKPAEAEPGDEIPPELKMNAPVRPMRKELEEHVVSHFPFRSWCEACVRGKAKANPHKSSGPYTDETTPVVTVDYCFMNSRTDDVLFGREDACTNSCCQRSMDETSFCPRVTLQRRDKRSIWIQGTPERHQEIRILQTGHST